MDSLFSPRCVWVTGPIIVGAGPSGLAVAACLREQGVPFAVLERADCITSLWQRRTYDRLKLHLPKQFCGQLLRMPFPDGYPEYPTRRQFVDYLERYAAEFKIKPELGTAVLSARYDETSSGIWRVVTNGGDMNQGGSINQYETPRCIEPGGAALELLDSKATASFISPCPV
eukprot:XP_008671684.1 probable indole-3-pyruvate monooxygenase YUCCA9 [Zea mays]